MKESTKNEIKKNSIKGTSAAAGAVLGAIIEDAVFPEPVEAQGPDELEILDFTEGGPELPAEDEIVASPVEDQVADTVTEVEVEAQPANTAHAAPHAASHVASHAATSHAPVHATVEAAPEAQVESVVEESVEVIDTAVVEAEEDLDDIEVVSVGTNEPAQAEATVVEAGYEAPATGEVPDYMSGMDASHDLMDSRVDNSGLGSSDLVQDMPDYVNDANIDSFTGMA